MNKKQHFRDDDQWEKLGDRVPEDIKNWVAAKQPDNKHPIDKMVERQHAKGSEVAHMATGGMVPDDVRQWMEPQGAGMIGPSAFGNSQPPPVAPPPASAPPVPPQPIAPPPAPVAPVAPEAPPTDFNAQADQIMGSSPEQRQADFQRTQAPNAVNALSTFGAGLGDAIARGYGHDAGAHNMENVQGIIQSKNKALMENMKDQAAMGKERFGLEQTLEAKNPTSPFSRVMQKAYGSTLRTMPGGQSLTDQQISLMPGSTISDILSKKVDLSKAIAEVTASTNYKDAARGIQLATLDNTVQHQRAEESEKENQQKMDANKALAGRGVWKRITDFATQDPSVKALKQQAGIGEPTLHFASEAEAEAARPAPGTVVTINGRKARAK